MDVVLMLPSLKVPARTWKWMVGILSKWNRRVDLTIRPWRQVAKNQKEDSKRPKSTDFRRQHFKYLFDMFLGHQNFPVLQKTRGRSYWVLSGLMTWDDIFGPSWGKSVFPSKKPREEPKNTAARGNKLIKLSSHLRTYDSWRGYVFPQNIALPARFSVLKLGD